MCYRRVSDRPEDDKTHAVFVQNVSIANLIQLSPITDSKRQSSTSVLVSVYDVADLPGTEAVLLL